MDMESIRENPRRMILIGLVLLVLICLIAYLVFNIFFNNDQAVGVVPSAPSPATTEEATQTPTPATTDEATATPTRVLQQETVTVVPLSQVTATVTLTPTVARPTPTAIKPVATKQPAPPAVSSGPQPGEIKNLLKNGDFEQGFDQRSVALEWQPFRNDSFQAIYTNETFPYVESGSSAQRITIVGATQPNRYAGIYQQVEVVPNQVYTLTLHGQVRSGPGDVNQSSYGYRMQYALSQAGLQNWENVPEADWVELPWDEQPISASVTKFYSYTTTVSPSSAKITLFVRGWNKWPDQSEGQYTFDNFSLVGPSSIAAPLQTSSGGGASAATSSTTATTTTTTTGGDQMVDKGLPTTGAGEGHSFIQDGRFWGSLLILLLLAAGAVYRARWGY